MGLFLSFKTILLTVWKRQTVCTLVRKNYVLHSQIMYTMYDFIRLSMECAKSLMPATRTHITMLQKLSKCEVKAWTLMNLLPLRFYVKSNFGEFNWSKKEVIFGNFGGYEYLLFSIWAIFQVPNLPKFKV